MHIGFFFFNHDYSHARTKTLYIYHLLIIYSGLALALLGILVRINSCFLKTIYFIRKALYETGKLPKSIQRLVVRLPWWLSGKESACQAGNRSSVSGLGRSPGEGNGNPLLYSCLGNPMDRGAWWIAVCGVEKELDTREWVNNVQR